MYICIFRFVIDVSHTHNNPYIENKTLLSSLLRLTVLVWQPRGAPSERIQVSLRLPEPINSRAAELSRSSGKIQAEVLIKGWHKQLTLQPCQLPPGSCQTPLTVAHTHFEPQAWACNHSDLSFPVIRMPCFCNRSRCWEKCALSHTSGYWSPCNSTRKQTC